MLTSWFAQNNVIKNGDVSEYAKLTSAPYEHRVKFTVDGLITGAPTTKLTNFDLKHTFAKKLLVNFISLSSTW